MNKFVFQGAWQWSAESGRGGGGCLWCHFKADSQGESLQSLDYRDAMRGDCILFVKMIYGFNILMNHYDLLLLAFLSAAQSLRMAFWGGGGGLCLIWQGTYLRGALFTGYPERLCSASCLRLPVFGGPALVGRY